VVSYVLLGGLGVDRKGMLQRRLILRKKRNFEIVSFHLKSLKFKLIIYSMSAEGEESKSNVKILYPRNLKTLKL
jgi:hypothetical protein